MEYSFSYKRELPVDESWNTSHDVFISAFNASERVRKVFDKANAPRKFWLVFPEYQYQPAELPTDAFICQGNSEGEQILSFFRNISIELENCKLCVDITGFMRPQLAFLLKFLHQKNIKKFDLIYSEPLHYLDKEKTKFSDGNVQEVRQIMGFEGNHHIKHADELLIIGSGYDHHLIKSVCNHKEHAEISQIIGFPSLLPDMYQENLLKIALASDALGPDASKKTIFAPANDPFITAEVLSETVKAFLSKVKTAKNINIYLCPLSTKPQTVGFVLFYLKELQHAQASMIYPFFTKYERETSTGLNKIWLYTVEF